MHIVLVCTEWLPRKGGLASFNRSLAIALAHTGNQVTCLVGGATPDDHADASATGVSLLVPQIGPGLPNLFAPVKFETAPQLVVGHDRHTGEAAAVQAGNAHARLMLVVHTNPDELEMLKNKPHAATVAEERFEKLRRLAAGSDIVCAVGPRLTRKVGTMLDDGYGGRPIYRLDPGLTEPLGSAERRISPECICLVLGRTEDIAIKGLDIAASAFGAMQETVRTTAKPVLWLRGAAPGEAEALHATLSMCSGVHRGDIVVRNYEPYSDVIAQELLRSSLVLMPSRSEGFGLVALEALSRGTPALISSRSGLAETLHEFAPGLSAPFIVDVNDDLDSDISRWREAIEQIVLDRPTAFSKTRELRDALAQKLNWETTVEQLLNATCTPPLHR